MGDREMKIFKKIYYELPGYIFRILETFAMILVFWLIVGSVNNKSLSRISVIIGSSILFVLILKDSFIHPSIDGKLKVYRISKCGDEYHIVQNDHKCKRLKYPECVLDCMKDDMMVIKEFGQQHPEAKFKTYTQSMNTVMIKENAHIIKEEKFKAKKRKGKIDNLTLEKRMINKVCKKCPDKGTEKCKYNTSETANTNKHRKQTMYGIIFDFNTEKRI